ncbi:hypothetical protein JNUCC1_02262 [Lentibacillus sp. JNUCC-1]|uniref:BREX-1 system adenine-specific DNA-methyltransferase PglX n=1 Tax=Lentibacillus sp. JNUCC-1 TaxID=2654513 RepID=UPI0012E7DD86|nr:BREX-1 system adenine-specific DNA-methyltransferase PglX [Lentibacillus sp. JNUCC-1]MUV38424.1 hypothetical protein [Lentibacillus sp. JNUCC-1]
MNKGAIKRFATTARRKLIADVGQKAFELGISPDHVKEAEIYEDGFMINGQFYSQPEIRRRDRLINEIEQKGYGQVIDEVAYTWFNRFIALRYMEVNDYLPSGIRILSSIEPDKKLPDALSEVMLLIDDLGLDEETVFGLQDVNDDEGLFKYILVKQCNQLGEWMPVMFEEIADYTELLLPGNLLADTSVIRDMVSLIEEDDWTKEVEIIGWLYQYYISEKKDDVFAALRKNKKITKENIPAATELFTPRWIVQYMVDNSLGRLWLESHKDEAFKQTLPYYLESADQPENVKVRLQDMKDSNLDPTSITFLDPCMGSGHILVYAFEVLFDIYKSVGYREQDIPHLILEHNLYGLDIDPRAGQLAYFAVLMKAMQYNYRLFERPIKTNLYWIEESNTLTEDDIDVFAGESGLKNDAALLVQTFKDAKLYGSAVIMPDLDLSGLRERLDELKQGQGDDMFSIAFQEEKIELVEQLINQAEVITRQYQAVVTNPPYMGRKGMNAELTTYLRKHYKDSSADLYAVFMEVASRAVKDNGFIGLINQHSWMFLSSFEKLREKMLKSHQIYSMAHLGTRAFAEIGGEVVQTTAFVLRKKVIPKFVATFVRLVDVNNAEGKMERFFDKSLRYERTQNGFSDIPGSPVAYWASERVRNIFKNEKLLQDIAEPKAGLSTGNNLLFQRVWTEVDILKIGFRYKSDSDTTDLKFKWFPCESGGDYRKWYGNSNVILNWFDNGTDIKNFRDKQGKQRSAVRNSMYYFQAGLTWNKLSSSKFSIKLKRDDSIFDDTSRSAFPINRSQTKYLLAMLISKLSTYFISYLNPTLSFTNNDIKRIPVVLCKGDLLKRVNSITDNSISISKSDWDSFETSWDFKKHPFLEFQNGAAKLYEAFDNWAYEADGRFCQLKENEEELNRIFIELYGLEDELTPDVPDEEVTVNKADQERDVKSFLSYAVGVMFGRYSLDEEGLAFAGGTFDPDQYHTFQPDQENVIPITDDVYFEDDIVTRLITILKLTFGEEDLEANLDFIADTLKKRGSETSRQRIRRYFLKEFYKDHVRTYQKRPIYWQFESGKQDGFKALVYLHRYDPGLVARVRTQYLHAQQRKYEDEIRRRDDVLESDASRPDKTRAAKEKEKLQKQLQECRQYDEIIAHVANQAIDLDLDDGVKGNYAKFQNIQVPQGEGKKPLQANLLTKI